MLDIQNLTPNAKVDWFMEPSSSSNECYTWNKPSGCNFVYILAVGGGGCGGGGLAGVSGSSRGGGSGGGSGAIATLLVPEFLITDTLFINVGLGGVATTTGSTLAAPTIVSAYRVFSATEYYLYANAGGNGNIGTTGNAVGGAAGAASAITACPLGSVGIFKSFAGITGSTGGNSTNAGTDASLTYFLSGAAGGGGIFIPDGLRAGGNVISSYASTSPTIISGGNSSLNLNGNSGIFIPKRFAFFGGAGGASSNGIGGNGGNGAPGCGGGGGGAGLDSGFGLGTSGFGGNGGNGFVMIVSY